MNHEKKIEKQWKNKVADIYESCPKCGYSIGHLMENKDGKRVHTKCPECRTMMTDLSIDEKEYMLSRM